MSIVLGMLAVSILLGVLFLLAFLWASRGGQFDDLDSPAHRMLFDDDDEPEGESR